MVKSILELVGKTPLVELTKINDTGSTILAKMEALNPSGSIKDVMALYMMELAEKRGLLKPGGTIIEATSGNTGISFAMLAPLKGYKFIAVMPEHMSKERKQLMQAFGAEIVLTPEKEGFPGTIKRAEQLGKENKNSWLPRQFENPDNIAAQREITAKSILQEVKEPIDAFVAGGGTWGTLMGVGEALRKVYPGVKLIGVEPEESAVVSGGKPGSHLIQGIGPGFIPSLLNMDLVDEMIKIKSSDAVNMTRRLIKEEGLMVGISSGANVLASLDIARRLGKGKTVVTVLADRGERYLSMDLF
jgi:cysteine synthase A